MNCTSSKLLVAHIFFMQRSYYHFNMNTHENSEEGSFLGSTKKTIADKSNKTPSKVSDGTQGIRQWSPEEESLVKSISVQFSLLMGKVGDDIVTEMISTLRHTSLPFKLFLEKIKNVKSCTEIFNKVIQEARCKRSFSKRK